MRSWPAWGSTLCVLAVGACRSTSVVPEEAASVLAKLARSRQAWDALVAEMGGDYSYMEENCVRSSVSASQTFVDVRAGRASIANVSDVPQRNCEVFVNRYESFSARTLPELYTSCDELVRSLGAAMTVTFDSGGILEGCFETDGGNGDESGCLDACGSGFYLRDLTFR